MGSRRNHPIWASALGALMCVWVVGALPGSAEAQTDEEYLAGFGGRLDKIARQVRSAQGLKVDQTRFSVKAAVGALGARPSVQKLFFFVRDEISFEPYEGAQRGPVGALMSRSGSSVDQALLLQAMLASTGVEARLASGDLSRDDRVRLVSDMIGKAKLGGDIPDAMPVYDPSRDRALMSSVERHYWVEAKVGDKWVAMDPSFPRGVYGVAPTARKATHDGIPDEAMSRVVVKVFVVEDNGGGGQILSVTRDMKDILHRNVVLSFESLDRHGDTRAPRIKVGRSTDKGRRFRWKGLQRLWVEFSFERGGKTRSKLVRDLQIDGSTTRLIDADQQVFSLMVLHGWMPGAFLSAVAGQEFAKLQSTSASVKGALDKEATKAMREREVGTQFAAFVEDVLGQSAGIVALTYANVADQIALHLAATHGVRAFYAEPRVLVVAGVRHKDRLYWQLDLRQDSMRAVPAAGLPLAMAQAFQAFRGRFASQFEGAVLGRLTGKSAISVDRIFKTALSKKTPVVTLSPSNIEKVLDGLPLSNEARDRLSTAVRRQGHIAIVPSRAISLGDVDTVGWWELDSTGAILGVKENGTHGTDTFSDSMLTGSASTAAPRTGGMRILVFDEALALVDHLSNTVVTLLKSAPNVCPVICAAASDLKQLPALMCLEKGQRPASKINLKAEAKACLTPEAPSDDILGLGQSCLERVRPARCGAIVGLATLSGMYKPTFETAPAGRIAGPWERADLPPVSLSACGCR